MRKLVVPIFLLTFLNLAVAQPTYRLDVIENTSKAWNGQDIQYPVTKYPTITSGIIYIPKETALPWHKHEIPMMIYVKKGALLLEEKNGQSKILETGQTAVEAVGTIHRGVSLDEDVELVAFYLGAFGKKNTVVEHNHGEQK